MLARRAWPPLSLLAPLLLVLQLWPGAARGLGFSRPRFEQGAWWEPLSAQFVHLGLQHALANAAALLLVAWLLRRTAATRAQLAVLAGALAGVALQLALDAGCAHYAGFSGALHGWLGGALALALARAPATAAPRWQRLLLGALALKVGLELLGWWPSAWNFPVHYPSHAAGLAGGLCAAAIVALAGRLSLGSGARQQRG